MPNKDGKPIPADLPAGHKRDELNRVITDQLQEQQDEEERNFGGRIDPAKMGKIDNEIAGFYEGMHKRMRAGMPELPGKRPGFVYAWFPNEDHFRTSEARVVVRSALLDAKNKGYFPVTDEHSKDIGLEFRGPDGGDTLRRWGDTILYAINKADYQLLMLDAQRRMKRQGAVEENYVNFGRQALRGRGQAYDQNDPRFAQKMGREKTQPFVATVAPQGEQER